MSCVESLVPRLNGSRHVTVTCSCLFSTCLMHLALYVYFILGPFLFKGLKNLRRTESSRGRE